MSSGSLALLIVSLFELKIKRNYNYAMRRKKDKENLRDRTYQETYDGDYLDSRQYMVVAVSLFVTHSFMELFYIWTGCTPMVFINIASILIYVLSALLISKGYQLVTVWLMEGEIFWHVIFACIFMGLRCGYQLWLFGTFSSIFLPFFIPNLSKRPKIAIGIYAVCIVVGFETLVLLGRHDLLPTEYQVGDKLASTLYYINAALGFISIMIYTSIYNQRMSAKNQELQYVADHDGLTGIFNRKKTQSILEAEIQRQKETTGERLAVAILDIDFFKKVNDTYGHQAGDEVLVAVTSCFRRYREKGLLYGRWGGEEFLLISPETYSYEEFAELLNNLREDIQSLEISSEGQLIKVTASIGSADYEESLNLDKFIQRADERLYIAKESGRNRVISE